MNYNQLVQDCIDGKQSCTEAAEMILNEIRGLQRAFNEVVGGVISEYDRNDVEPTKNIFRVNGSELQYLTNLKELEELYERELRKEV